MKGNIRESMLRFPHHRSLHLLNQNSLELHSQHSIIATSNKATKLIKAVSVPIPSRFAVGWTGQVAVGCEQVKYRLRYGLANMITSALPLYIYLSSYCLRIYTHSIYTYTIPTIECMRDSKLSRHHRQTTWAKITFTGEGRTNRRRRIA